MLPKICTDIDIIEYRAIVTGYTIAYLETLEKNYLGFGYHMLRKGAYALPADVDSMIMLSIRKHYLIAQTLMKKEEKIFQNSVRKLAHLICRNNPVISESINHNFYKITIDTDLRRMFWDISIFYDDFRIV